MMGRNVLGSRDLERVERFQAAFNDIHRLLKKAVEADRHMPFVEAVTRYATGRPYWAEDAEFLRQTARLRNVLVHELTRPREYLAVPAPTVLARLEAVLSDLANPPRAVPIFARSVTTVGPDASLVQVMRIVASRDFSQLPVYGNRFLGLVTAYGITHWLGRHLTTRATEVDLENVTVHHVLKEEAELTNVRFAAPDTLVQDIRTLFVEQQLLEAVLIAEGGRADRPLLGIATRWDIAGLE